MSYLYILMVFKNILQLGGRSLACISRCFLSEQSKLGVRNHLSIVWPKIMPRRMYFKVHDTQSTTWEDPRAGQPEAPTHQRPVFWWALGIDRSMEYLGFVLPGWVATTAFKIPSTSLIHLLSNQLHLWPSYGNMTRLSSPAKGPCPPPPHHTSGEALAGDLEIVETGLAVAGLPTSCQVEWSSINLQGHQRDRMG